MQNIPAFSKQPLFKLLLFFCDVSNNLQLSIYSKGDLKKKLARFYYRVEYDNYSEINKMIKVLT